MFIVLEGLDGAGKSTQIRMLRRFFADRGVESEYVHFPRFDSPIYGELIARFLRGEFGGVGEVDPYLVALLFAGDRADAAPRIREWLAQGKAVILDRYVYSNVGFQCAKLPAGEERNRLADWILYLEFCHNGLPRPDVSLFLDVPFTFTERKLSELREGDDRADRTSTRRRSPCNRPCAAYTSKPRPKTPRCGSSIAAILRGRWIPRRVFLLKYVPSWHQYSKPMRKSRAFKLLANVCRLILACTFIVSGFTKVIDPWGTAMKVNEYLSIYGMESLQGASMAFSIWLCGAEMMMGCMLLFKVRIRLISIFAVLSMLFFTALTLLSATVIPVEDCGCFGEALKLTPWQTFYKNLALLPMALVVWWRYRPDKIFAFNPLEIVLTVTFFFLTMYLGYYCYRHLPLIDFLPYKVGVNIWEGMHAPVVEPGETETVLVYRNIRTGKLREFSLDDTAWQDAEKWEWVDTRTTDEMPAIRPLMSEFSLRDAEGDATEEIVTAPGRVYMLCVTSFDRLPRGCAKRFAKVVRRAAEEGARVVCLTPQPLYGVTYHDFGSGDVRCYNIDASTMKTMLRANNGMVVLEDGVIRAKKNCRDIRP